MGRKQHRGAIAQLGERWLCKPEVAGSIPAGSILTSRYATAKCCVDRGVRERYYYGFVLRFCPETLLNFVGSSMTASVVCGSAVS